jgi:hypothetical protein
MNTQNLKKYNKLSTSFSILIFSIIGCLNRIYYTNNHFLLSIIFIAIFIIFLSIIINSIKTKIAFKTMFFATSCIISYIATDISINLNKEALKKIFKKKYIYGIVLDADAKCGKNYYTISIKTNSLIKSNPIVKIISKKNIEIGANVYINKIYWISKTPNNDLELINQISKTKNLAAGISNNIKIMHPKESFLEKINNFTLSIKRKIISKTNAVLNKNLQEVYLSIFLGKGSCISKTTLEMFKQWGIVHFIARSGFHTGIIANTIQFIIFISTSNTILTGIIGIIFLITFSAISFTSIPFKRAILMFTIRKICINKKIKTSFLDIFSKCTIFFLITDPLLIMNLGFQLSFLATGVIALINHFKK